MTTTLNNKIAEYEQSKGSRELYKWLFSVGTFGLGAAYLWATTVVIQEGEIGLRKTASGKMVLLPPGRHSNFPWEHYPVEPVSLSKKIIQMGPYKIITVDTGYKGKTYNSGTLEVLDVGQHVIEEASHSFDGFISTKMETKKLHAVTALTSDNIGLTLYADVRYQIEDPQKAITQINDIEDSIKEIAEISISQIVSHHCLSDFAPAMSTAHLENEQKKNGVGNVVNELTNMIMSQLAELGIKLINIGLTSWQINDKGLAHELGQGAVIKSQTSSQLMAAKNAADVKNIEVTADVNRIIATAQAEANAIKIRGEALKDVAENLRDIPGGEAIYLQAQQCEAIRYAKNVHLFYSPLSTSGQNSVPPLVATVSTEAAVSP